MTTLEDAIKARDDFLRKNPKYVEFQKEIDRILDKTTNQQARLEALALLMAGNLTKLNEYLVLLRERLGEGDKN